MERKNRQTPQKKEYDNKYKREKKLCIAFRLSRQYDADLIDIYESIPNKMDWFRWALREFDSRRKKLRNSDFVPKNVPETGSETE